MIYLTNGNMPLNEAYNDEIVQEDNNTYQLTFRFPTSDPKWELLKEETFLTADDLHGEQDFVIFEVEKQQGYIQVYANQVFSLLNNYVVNAINLDRETGTSALSRFAGSITRTHPFSFFSDIEDRHTFNIDSKNAMEAFAKDKHSILGQWGGDLVRHGYQIRLLKNGGSENESLFMYKKNLSSYQHKTSTKSLRTRITFKTTIKGEGEKAPDKHYSVTIESPLINKYNQIYEDVVEVNDQDVKDEASLRKYGEQYFRTTLCDMLEDSLEIEVVGQSDVPVQMFDVVSIYHEGFGLDVRKKITKYTYSPMAKKLKSIGFGQFKSGLANAIGNMVSDALKNETQGLLGSVDAQIAKELRNANLAFDRKKEELVNQFTDELNAAKAKAEEVKQDISSEIDKRFQNFDNASIQEARRKAEEALRSAGASNSLAEEAKRISERAKTQIDNLKSSSQTAIEQIETFKTQYGTKLNEFKTTTEGLSTKMGAIETYISNDGQRQEELKRYARTESASQASAIREQISRDYVGKSAYQEDVRGLERRFSAISTQMDNDIATKIAQYKQTVDGQFASITSQMAGKANQTDFQQVRETSQLYERIIGRNENDISNKVARMALTNQLFQVEVSKNVGDSRNYVKNADFREGNKNWNESEKNGLHFNYNHSSSDRGKPGVHIYGDIDSLYSGLQQRTKLEIFEGEIFTVSFLISKDGASTFSGLDLGVHYRKNNEIISQKWISIPNSDIPDSRYKKMSFFFTSPKDIDELNLMLYGEQGKTINLYISEVKLEKGSFASDFTLSPEDTEEAVRSVQSQLAGSWAIQNINSAGDIISGINLGSNGQNRITGKATHITGDTLIDNAVIKSAMIDKLKTANFEAGSVTTTILDAEAVTAEKLKVDQAFFNKLVANEAYLSQLFAKKAFITQVQSVTLDASKITTGILKGREIQGGSITGTSISGGTITGTTISGGTISGGTLTGHTKIKLGTYGSFDTVNGGLQINVPRVAGSKDGLGVQFIGSYGRGENVPYGLYIYKDPDFTTGNPPRSDDNFLLTVEGYIQAKGIGWLRTGTGSVGGRLTATIGLWNSNNVYLSFGGSANDIFYTYNNKAYSLWEVLKAHFSDRRLKENIIDCKHNALDYIQQFQFKEYDWKKQEDRPRPAHTKIGLIAQEVQAVDPTLVYENGDTLNLDNLRLTTMALKAIQELALENKTLTRRLENLESERRTV